MKKRIKNSFNTSKPKAILFFLFLATIFWALTKFSRQYTATATATVRYLNIPKLTQVKDNNPRGIDFTVTASGFQFLFYRFQPPMIDIDLESFYKDDTKEVIVPKFELMALVSSQLKSDITIRNLRNDALIVGLDPIITKKVPIKVITNFTYKNGFRPLDSLKVEPDSVVVFGPASYLEGIHFVRTNSIARDDIDKTFSQLVQLTGFKNPKVSINQVQVNLSLSIAEFTQKRIEVPIQLINVPKETIVKLIPKNTMVTFNVSVDDYNKITASDFKLVCDFVKRDPNEDFIFVTLEEFPFGVNNIELITKKIDYLIFK